MPDMFEYKGPLDLTEYYVRNTELNAETGGLIRVKVSTALVAGDFAVTSDFQR